MFLENLSIKSTTILFTVPVGLWAEVRSFVDVYNLVVGTQATKKSVTEPQENSDDEIKYFS